MCNFSCLKHTLIFLNTMYLVAGAVLLYMSASGKLTIPPIEILPAEKGIIACEMFTIIIAIFGLFATFRQHQVILFFYMFILFFLLTIQFIFSEQLLSKTDGDFRELAQNVWNQMNTTHQIQYMEDHQCCSFDQPNSSDPTCNNLSCCTETCDCPTCGEKLTATLLCWHKLIGRWSIVCSIAEIFGVWLTKRYRNLKDPRAHPSAFL